MYYTPHPPFLVALSGIFIAITCGSAFQNLMSQKLRDAYQNPSKENAFIIKESATIATYFGISLGVLVFLGGGLLIFGFGIIPSYGVALLLTLFTGGFIWDQIGKVLLQLEQGGSKALDLE